MKSKSLFIILLFLSITLFAQEIYSAEKKKQEKVTFLVGMHCLSCKERIEKNIPMEQGVKDIDVNLEKKEVTVTYNPNKTTPKNIQAAIIDLGYSVKEKDAVTDPISN